MIKQFINSFFRSNSFIYIDEKSSKCVLIDCGDIDPIIDYIKSRKLNLIGVMITHSHYDHIYGLNKLLRYYPNIQIYTSEYGLKGLLSDKLNLSKYHDDKFILNNPKNVNIIKNNKLLLGSIVINVLDTPGHDQSCLTYIINNYIFTGDSYLPSYKLVSIFPKSDKKMAFDSELKIKSTLNSNNVICPGHGCIISSNDL